MNEKERALKILKVLKREYKKYKLPSSSSVLKKTKNSFKVLIATILSARAKDTQTEKISFKLFKTADTPKKLAKIDTKELEKIIYSIGFYKTKSERIKKASKYLLENYNGKVPDRLEDLLKIPGVGRKVANIILAECFGKSAIAIDAHCLTFANRLGFVKGRNSLKVEKALENIFPKSQWRYINRSIVVHGQNICAPISPKCSICPISKLCPRIEVNRSR